MLSLLKQAWENRRAGCLKRQLWALIRFAPVSPPAMAYSLFVFQPSASTVYKKRRVYRGGAHPRTYFCNAVIINSAPRTKSYNLIPDNLIETTEARTGST